MELIDVCVNARNQRSKSGVPLQLLRTVAKATASLRRLTSLFHQYEMLWVGSLSKNSCVTVRRNQT